MSQISKNQKNEIPDDEATDGAFLGCFCLFKKKPNNVSPDQPQRKKTKFKESQSLIVTSYIKNTEQVQENQQLINDEDTGHSVRNNSYKQSEIKDPYSNLLLKKQYLQVYDDTNEDNRDTSQKYKILKDKQIEKTLMSQSNPTRTSLKMGQTLSQLNPREKQSLKRLNPNISEYPLDQIFELYDKDKQNFILVKRTQKKVKSTQSFLNTSYSQNQNEQDDLTKEIYEKGIKANPKDIYYITPQQVASHIAKRSKEFPIIIDAFCGVGGCTIQLAKEHELVIAIDKDEQQLKLAQENIGQYKFQNKVEFILTDYLRAGKLKSDIVFINPSYPNQPSQKLDIFTQISPDLVQVLSHSYTFSENIILLLPKFIEIEQLPTLFYRFYKEQMLLNKNLNSYSIEIEEIFLNQKKQYYVIYYGECSNISVDEELDYLQQLFHINSKVSGEHMGERLTIFLEFLYHKIRVKGIIKYIKKAEKTRKDSNALQNQNYLQSFLDILVEKNIVQRKEIQQFFNSPIHELQNFNFELFPNSLNSQAFRQLSGESNDFQIMLSKSQKNISKQNSLVEKEVQDILIKTQDPIQVRKQQVNSEEQIMVPQTYISDIQESEDNSYSLSNILFKNNLNDSRKVVSQSHDLLFQYDQLTKHDMDV